MNEDSIIVIFHGCDRNMKSKKVMYTGARISTASFEVPMKWLESKADCSQTRGKECFTFLDSYSVAVWPEIVPSHKWG